MKLVGAKYRKLLREMLNEEESDNCLTSIVMLVNTLKRHNDNVAKEENHSTLMKVTLENKLSPYQCVKEANKHGMYTRDQLACEPFTDNGVIYGSRCEALDEDMIKMMGCSFLWYYGG